LGFCDIREEGDATMDATDEKNDEKRNDRKKDTRGILAV